MSCVRHIWPEMELFPENLNILAIRYLSRNRGEMGEAKKVENRNADGKSIEVYIIEKHCRKKDNSNGQGDY